MRIHSEQDILDPVIRKQIIDEILGSENQKRKDEAYRRYLSNKDQTDKFVIKMLLNQFDQSTVEQMAYSVSNVSIIRKVIDKLARVYNNGVTREVEGDEADTEKIQQLEDLLDFNTKLKTINKYLKLNRNTVCYVKPCVDVDMNGLEVYSPKLLPLSPHLYDVVEQVSDRTKPMVYILSNYEVKNQVSVSLDASKEGRSINNPQPVAKGDGSDQGIADAKEDEDVDNRTFIFWTNNYHFTCNSKGAILINGMPHYTVMEEEIENPIGEMPFINFAIDQDNSFWAEGGKDLVDGGVLVNCMLTNMNHIAVTQGYGQFYMKGKNLPRNVLLGPDKAIVLEHEEGEPVPEIGYLSSNPPLSDLRQIIEMQTALILTSNNLSTSGVSTQLNGNNSAASGISMIIDKSESQEDVNDQQQVFMDNEPDIWRVISKWIALYDSQGSLSDEFKGLALGEDFEENFILKFGKPQTILSETEQLSNLEKRKDLGLNTMVDLMQKDQPELDDEQAINKLEEIRLEKESRMAMAIGPMTSSDNEDKDADADISEEDEGDDEDDKQQLGLFE